MRYSTGEEELYDLGTDPYQLENLADSRPAEVSELSERIRNLEACEGAGCRAAEDGTPPQ